MSNSDSGLESTVLKLQSLQLQFANIMTQYKQAYATYLSDISSKTTAPKYNTINSSVYFCKNCTHQDYIMAQSGQPPTTDSATECEALCSTNSKCNGGTYQSSNKVCWLTSSPAERNEMYSGRYAGYTAIIPQNVQNAAVLQTLNQQLIGLNEKITTELTSLEPIEQSDINAKNSQRGKLREVYNSLLYERMKIDKMQQEYKDITQSYDDNSLYVTQTSALFLIWFLILIIILVFTIKLIFFPEFKMLGPKILFWIFIICILIILTVYMQLPSVFGMWFLLILMIILMKMKIIPQP
jgi:hypothetical protein